MNADKHYIRELLKENEELQRELNICHADRMQRDERSRTVQELTDTITFLRKEVADLRDSCREKESHLSRLHESYRLKSQEVRDLCAVKADRDYYMRKLLALESAPIQQKLTELLAANHEFMAAMNNERDVRFPSYIAHTLTSSEWANTFGDRRIKYKLQLFKWCRGCTSFALKDCKDWVNNWIETHPVIMIDPLPKGVTLGELIKSKLEPIP